MRRTESAPRLPRRRGLFNEPLVTKKLHVADLGTRGIGGTLAQPLQQFRAYRIVKLQPTRLPEFFEVRAVRLAAT